MFYFKTGNFKELLETQVHVANIIPIIKTCVY